MVLYRETCRFNLYFTMDVKRLVLFCFFGRGIYCVYRNFSIADYLCVQEIKDNAKK